MRSSTPLIAALIGAFTLSAAGTSADPAAVVEALEASRLDPSGALDIGGVVIDIEPVQLRIEGGALFPTTPVDGRVRELIFVGKATVELDPPNEIEAGQLEFHTGNPRLYEPVHEAVLVICSDAAVDALLKDRPPATPDEATVARAQELLLEWREGKEREVVGARAGMLLDVLGDPAYEDYFAGRFVGTRLGSFLVLVDPDAPEQVSVGQFVRAELSDTETRRVRRFIRRQQRRDRLLGLTLDELGTFDQWMMASIRDRSGRPSPGAPPFEATHYELEIKVDGGGERIAGTGKIAIRATAPSRRIVRLSMDRDLRLTAVLDARGERLPLVQDSGSAYALLPEPPPHGVGEIRVEFEGAMIEKVEGTLFALTNTQSWYPHVGGTERATYDVTFRWPQKYDVVAAGHRVDGETKGDVYWERRAIDVPVRFFSFELGRFDFIEESFGDVRARFAFDRRTDSSAELQSQIVATTRHALRYYQQVFGPYPLQDLTVVTAPRGFAQGLLSFISLPSSLMVPQDFLSRLLGGSDRRLVVAHELAHQWWGNMLGWSSYRDQWLSEAMATRAAARWAAQLPGEAIPPEERIGLWQLALNTNVGGRPLEQIGPVVLGHRLDSSKANAMEPIVYRKGAVVLGMLEQIFGQEAFDQFQQKILEVANYRDISTEDYLEALQRLSGLDLTWFAERYVHGTGIPRVVYGHEIHRLEDGSWRVDVEARLVPHYTFRYRVEQLADGRFDVRRTVLASGDPENAALAVPFRIAVLRHDVDRRLLKEKNMKRAGDRLYNAVIPGRVFLQGATTHTEFRVDYEPVAFWLDPERVVLGMFVQQEDAPKLLALQDAYAAEAAGERDKVLATLDRLSGEADAAGEAWEKSLRVEAELYRARLAMDRGDLVQARECLDRAERSIPDDLESRLERLRTRMSVLSEDYRSVFKPLRRTLMNSPWRLNAEELLLLAVAAKQLGEAETLSLAVTSARLQGADPDVLVDDMTVH